MIVLLASFTEEALGQSSCENSDFSMGDFTNWTGYTSVYPQNTAGANIGNNVGYYYTEGIVPGRHTIITNSTPDPFTCGNVMTIAPGETSSVRLGNGGFGGWGNGVRWQRDYLEYTVSVSNFNALLIYKYAVVLQDPNSGAGVASHAAPIKPRFKVSITDQNDQLIDPVCGIYSVTADESVDGFRNCSQADAQANGGQFASNGGVIYRAWTTVGVDLRQYVGQDVTLLFETWDCGLGGHFGYAYLSANCDSMGIDAESCAANDGVTLTAPEGFSYVWSTGQTTQTIDIPNAIAGDTVRVVLTTTTGCSTDLYTVLNPAKIRAVFKATPTTICQNETVSFQDSSWSKFLLDNNNVPIVKKTWKFGDGQVDDSTNTGTPNHIYSNYGEYEITLIVENDYGCVDSVKHTITVKPFPVADFTFEPNCVNKATTFESASLVISGNISDWEWTFGDGGTSNDVDPTHVYNVNGTYDVELIVVSDFGCSDTVEKEVESWQLPIANFNGGQACTGDSVFLINTSTSLIVDSIKSNLWSFGDGSSLSILESPSHVYHSSGVFDVELSIVSDRGCEHDTTFKVNILQGPTVAFDIENVCLNTPVEFENNSTPIDSISKWTWDFGDGNGNITDEEPTHTYTNSSFYTVNLIGENNNGCIDSVKKTLQVAPNPIVNFKTEDVCIGSEVEFKDQTIISSGFSSAWEWAFGDDSSSTNQNINHLFLDKGVYNVQLTVTSDLGCSDSLTKAVLVKASPIPFFSVDSICLGGTLQFVNESKSGGAGAMNYVWDFGDGSPLKDKINPLHTYSIDSTFTAKLTVSQNGCIQDTVLPVVVLPIPKAVVGFESVCSGVVTMLRDSSYSKSTIVEWDWFFSEDNSHQITKDASYLTTSQFGFDIQLSVVSENGCTDTVTEHLAVVPNPTVDFITQSKCEGDDMRFTSLATVSKGFVQEWLWTFGDGITSTVKDPIHAFDTSGFIDVHLVVTTSDNCTDSVEIPVEVWGLPIVNFSTPEVCLGDVTDFNDSTIVGNGTVISSWVWNVGDGSLLKSQQNISHLYSVVNNFTVTLSVLTSNGCADTLSQTAIVNSLPAVDFSNSAVCFGEPTSFANLSKDSLSINSWYWDFGEGSVSNLENPENLFVNVGGFDVELVGVDTNNCFASELKNIIVKPLPTPIFDVDHYTGCVPQCMLFFDYSIAPLDTINIWNWDFGDGGTSTDQAPQYCYEDPGTYDVTLSLTTVNGCENTLDWDSMITIYPMPIAGFSFGPQPTTELNSAITFNDESQGTDEWLWDFGDGNLGVDTNPINDYYSYGDYEVTQIVKTRFGCIDSLSDWVRIEPDYKLYAANGFTPNGDGINDVFLPVGIGINPNPDKYTFMVFDRWGQKIFETHDINKGWDGRVNSFEFLNTGKVQQIDVYVWKVIVYDITSDGDRHEKVGHVSLIK